MPKFGISKSNYSFDREKNIIAKGLSSIKYMSDGLAEELFALAHRKSYAYFIDLLYDIDRETTINTRQLDILIKLDFFSDFGNQRELLRITEMFYDVFKKGEAKKIARDKVDGTQLEPIIAKYAIGTTKMGQFAKGYTLLDVHAILIEIEKAIKSVHMSDLPDVVKINNFMDVMGYAGYTSGREEDRRKLYIQGIFPVFRKKDGAQFGYNIATYSVGSGKESRFTVFNKEYNKTPVVKGDIIYVNSWKRDGKYFTLTSYDKLAT